MRNAVIASLAAASLSTVSARASTLYAVDAKSADVWAINPSNASTIRIGPIGATHDSPNDMASDTRTASFRLWELDFTEQLLLRINPTTGAGTAVGKVNPSTGWSMATLAFDPITEKLFGTASMSGGSLQNDTLYLIDPNTGVSSPIASMTRGFISLGFDNLGQLYGVSRFQSPEVPQFICHINTATGAIINAAPLRLPTIFDLATRPEDGITFLISQDPSTAPTADLYTVDLASGATVRIGAIGTTHNFTGIAFGPSVPEPSILISLAGALMLLSFRRSVASARV